MNQEPKARQALMNDILETLYQPPALRIQALLANLIRHNSALRNNRQTVLQFAGKMYSTNGAMRGSNAVPAINTIHPDLRPKLQELLAEEAEIAREKSVVIGYIQKVLMATEERSDYEILFPQSLHATLHRHQEFFAKPNKSMSPQFLAAFADSSERYIQAIKLRLMTNFIEPS